jgi:hypothetical protein
VPNWTAGETFLLAHGEKDRILEIRTELLPDELERLIAQRRHPSEAQVHAPARAGRPAAISHQTVEQIQAAHGAGKTLAQIARDLNTARIPTAHGGSRWWPSTVRAVVERVSA